MPVQSFPSKAAKKAIEENILRLVTPKSWWFKNNPITAIERATFLESSFKRIHLPDCGHIHDHSCLVEITMKAMQTTRKSIILYCLAHIVPFLVFRKGKDKYSPKNLKKLFLGILRSLAFIATFAFLAKASYCLGPVYLDNWSPFWVKLGAGLGGSGILVENPSRWPEMTFSIFFRLFESWPVYFSKMHLWPEIPFGKNLLLGLSFAFLAGGYYKESETMRAITKTLMKIIIGKPTDKCNDEKEEITKEEEKETEIVPEN